VAESVDPTCVTGQQGSASTASVFAAQLTAVRQKIQQQFPNIIDDWNDGAGMRVRLTGVGFYDRQHNQVGRALNGIELHPLLDIEFNPAGPVTTPTTPPAAPTATAVALTNPGFENGGQGWTATSGVITTDSHQAAHSGTGKAWLGGYGETHTDRLSQQITLPPTAHAISLTFFLHIATEENNTQAFDKLFVRIRNASGTVVRRLKTFTNQQAAAGFTAQSFDITALKGQTIRIELEAQEDNGSRTSFVVDDFAIIVES